MGLDDRDYMRERHRRHLHRMVLVDRDRPFTPPKEGPSLLTMVVTWIGVAFLLFKAYGWWQEKKQVERATRPLPAATAGYAQRAGETPTGRQQPPEQPTVHSYTAPPPPPAARPAITRAPEPAPRQNAAPTTSGTIYHCKAYDGGTFWSTAHCAEHRALIDRIASVPPGLPFDQQVQIAEQRRQAMMTTVQAQSAPSPVQVTTTTSSNKAECQHLDARVQQLDAMARQPQSAQVQDWIRAERKTARDRQFAIRC